MKIERKKPQLPLSNLGQRMLGEEPVITRLMASALARPNLLSLAAGFTDNACLPDAAVAKALAKLRNSDPTKSYLQYGQNRGDPGLRAALRDHLCSLPGEESLNLTPEDFLITNGSQQLLYMTVQLFCEPGDWVWVQAPSYFVFLELLRGLGVRPVSMPANADGGIDCEACRRQLQAWRSEGTLDRLRFAYMMGSYANPSARSLSGEEKTALARLFREELPNLPVVEDMAYRELSFGDTWPAPSMMSFPEWREQPVMYAGTLTKPFATGMKIGFGATTSAAWREGLARIKGHQDFGSSQFAQALLREVMTSGDYSAHLEHIRPHYAGKASALDSILEKEGLRRLGWDWRSPEGGLLLWLRAPDEMQTSFQSPLWNAAMEEEILYVPGDLCFAEGSPRNYVRLSFGAIAAHRLAEAGCRFARSVRRASK